MMEAEYCIKGALELTAGYMPLQVFFAGEALPAVCTEDHGGTTSSDCETVATARWEAA